MRKREIILLIFIAMLIIGSGTEIIISNNNFRQKQDILQSEKETEYKKGYKEGRESNLTEMNQIKSDIENSAYSNGYRDAQTDSIDMSRAEALYGIKDKNDPKLSIINETFYVMVYEHPSMGYEMSPSEIAQYFKDSESGNNNVITSTYAAVSIVYGIEKTNTKHNMKEINFEVLDDINVNRYYVYVIGGQLGATPVYIINKTDGKILYTSTNEV